MTGGLITKATRQLSGKLEFDHYCLGSEPGDTDPEANVFYNTSEFIFLVLWRKLFLKYEYHVCSSDPLINPRFQMSYWEL